MLKTWYQYIIEQLNMLTEEQKNRLRQQMNSKSATSQTPAVSSREELSNSLNDLITKKEAEKRIVEQETSKKEDGSLFQKAENKLKLMQRISGGIMGLAGGLPGVLTGAFPEESAKMATSPAKEAIRPVATLTDKTIPSPWGDVKPLAGEPFVGQPAPEGSATAGEALTGALDVLGAGSMATKAPAKVAGGIEEAVSKVTPTLEKNPLSLTPEELAKVNKKELSYLSKKGLETVKTTGGFFKRKAYEMTEQVKNLQKKFADLFTSNNPEKNMKNVVMKGKEYLSKTFDLFENNLKAVNEKTVRTKLMEALNADKTTTYASEFEKKDVAKKAVDSFINSIKEGTNKGIEEARVAWRSKMANSSGKLSEVKNVLHDAIKQVVYETLPPEKQLLYKEYKQAMAELYDIREILRAKIEAEVGGKTLLEKGAVVGGAITGFAGLKRLLTGHW